MVENNDRASQPLSSSSKMKFQRDQEVPNNPHLSLPVTIIKVSDSQCLYDTCIVVLCVYMCGPALVVVCSSIFARNLWMAKSNKEKRM